MSDDRISRLSERFKTHGTGRPKSSKRNRARRSFYLDTDLVEQLDQTYKDINHELYPQEVTKSEFLEVLMEFGLSNLSDVKSILDQGASQDN